MNSTNNVSEFLEENKECAYFNEKISDIGYKYINTCPPETYAKMLERGWRRFGNIHFVPECKTCNECRTIRIDVNNFKFSKSQRKLLKKNGDIDVYVQPPTLSLDHLNLFNKYHQKMTHKKGWANNDITPSEYQSSYVDGAGDYGKEILYFLDGKLIGVALSDMLGDAISAVYCYYDHDYADRSLGKYSILVQISIAKQLKIPYIFLGYWIKDHHSMGYKEDYAPFDILINRPTLEEDCVWITYDG
jgi:arginine-tRNA-protein transferase